MESWWKISLLTAISFCGSLTTMSSFALDSSNLLDNHHYGVLVVNLVTNTELSIGAFIGGKSLIAAIING